MANLNSTVLTERNLHDDYVYIQCTVTIFDVMQDFCKLYFFNNDLSNSSIVFHLVIIHVKTVN